MRRAAILVCLAILGGCDGVAALKRKKGLKFAAETRSWSHAISQLGGSGMWLVTRGYHVGDDMVAMASNSRVSHASIVDLERGEVIEAVGRGVVATPIDTFLSNAHLMQLIQPEGWTKESGLVAVAKARDKIGKGYDYLGIVGVPTSGRFYCSELAVWSMGLQVNRLGPKHVLHPREMHKYGTVLFASGARDGKPDFTLK